MIVGLLEAACRAGTGSGGRWLRAAAPAIGVTTGWVFPPGCLV
ncbi:MAG: hypothetical protein JWR29_872 [Tardiphaga sp.]|nr:hypothetical protein [Tardiphaga sp.]